MRPETAIPDANARKRRLGEGPQIHRRWPVLHSDKSIIPLVKVRIGGERRTMGHLNTRAKCTSYTKRYVNLSVH